MEYLNFCLRNSGEGLLGNYVRVCRTHLNALTGSAPRAQQVVDPSWKIVARDFEAKEGGLAWFSRRNATPKRACIIRVRHCPPRMERQRERERERNEWRELIVLKIRALCPTPPRPVTQWRILTVKSRNRSWRIVPSCFSRKTRPWRIFLAASARTDARFCSFPSCNVVFPLHARFIRFSSADAEFLNRKSSTRSKCDQQTRL